MITAFFLIILFVILFFSAISILTGIMYLIGGIIAFIVVGFVTLWETIYDWLTENREKRKNKKVTKK